MSRRLSWWPILLARCACGATFPAWPGRDRTGRCRDCRAAHDAGRLLEVPKVPTQNRGASA